MKPANALRLGLALGIGAAGGCSMIVPGDLEVIYCSQEGAAGPPVCDPGFACRFGECVPCMAKEICSDGIDNDCKNGVDDGCAGQGGVGGMGGDAGGSTGGGPPDGSFGGGNGGVSGSGGSLGGAGGDAASAGVGGGTGGSAGSPGVGTPCTEDSHCAVALGHFCVKDPAIFGVGASGTCSRGCCTSSDCGPDNVCFVTTRGNNLCFPGSFVNRPVLGTKSPGSSCTGPGDCRSGMCVNSLCVDACCSNGDCGGSTPHCTMRSVPGTDTKEHFYCGKAGNLSFNQLCFGGSSDCQSNFCLSSSVSCTTRCCKKSDCTAAGSDWECVYVTQTSYAGPVCGQVASNGTKGIGQSCATADECASGKCLNLGTLGTVCTDACCKNEDCGDTSQFACRPLSYSGTGLLLCVAL